MIRVKTTILYGLLLFSQFILPQGKWVEQNIYPTASSLLTAWPISKQKVIIGGSAGTMLTTTDGGAIWKQADVNCKRTFDRIYFVDSLSGWALANDFVYSPNDGGASRQKINITVKNDHYKFVDVRFINKNEGWILASSIYYYMGDFGRFPAYIQHTTDGGRSWNTIKEDFDGQAFAFSITSSKVLYVLINEHTYQYIVENVLYKTTDGGVTWNRMSLPTKFGNNVKMLFTDENTGWISGYKTTDGGKTWQYKFGAEKYLLDFDFLDSLTGCALFYNKFLYTSDGGNNWTETKISEDTYWGHIKMADKNTIWGCGISGFINKSTDCGKSWMELSKGENKSLNEISFFDDKTGWAFGFYGGILNTSDGGKNWVNQNSGIKEFFTSVSIIDRLNVIAVSEKYILKTTNGGNSWNIKLTDDTIKFQSVAKINDKVILACGLFGNLFRSTDCGDTWHKDYSIDETRLANICFIDSLTGWICGGNYVFKTSDAGKNWRKQTFERYSELWKIKFVNKNFGWLYDPSRNSFFYITKNGGDTWEKINVPDGENLRDICLIDEYNGYLAYYNDQAFCGSIRKTKDGGFTWGEEELLPIGGIFSMHFRNENLGWIAGAGGSILKYTDLTSNYISHNGNGIMNFPNPFNNATKICYKVNRPQNVKIKAYDILGKEIATLFEGKAGGGSNFVYWNAPASASGVYIVTVHCDDYFKTHKCLLIK